MIRVWSDAQSAGILDRGSSGSTFAYHPDAPRGRAVSVTMPVRVASWDVAFGLTPIFEMNLPEGALRERLLRMFAKAAGRFDDFDLLEIVGRSQIGRLRYSGLDQPLSVDVPFQSIDDILRARRGGELFEYLLNTFARHSGLSGVQPKVMIRSDRKGKKEGTSRTVLSATHIVKLWDPDEYPDLAANEYFCLTAAKKMGLDVPPFALSDDGAALVIERFDLHDGTYNGFEDFCVLNGLPTRRKYEGSYESQLFKRARDFLPAEHAPAAMETLFKLFVLNSAIRNGDAHLKNFGIVYNDVNGNARLAPVYDLVTTTAYIPVDNMALLLEGSKRWPDQRKLINLGQVRADLTNQRALQILEATADTLSDVAVDLRKYFRRSEYEVGQRMIASWETGIKEALGLSRGLRASAPTKRERAPRIARSDSLVLEMLRQRGGTITGTQKGIAAELGIPPSTLSASIARLAAKGLVSKDARRISLERTREV